MFIRHSHWLTIPSSLAPRQNDVICLNLHSRFGLFLSERVLCQSSFAQRDYSQCTYSQTTANGIAGVINELNHSYTITYAAHVSHSGIEIRRDHVGSIVYARQSVALGKCGGNSGKDKCRRHKNLFVERGQRVLALFAERKKGRMKFNFLLCHNWIFFKMVRGWIGPAPVKLVLTLNF